MISPASIIGTPARPERPTKTFGYLRPDPDFKVIRMPGKQGGPETYQRNKKKGTITILTREAGTAIAYLELSDIHQVLPRE